jgi:hypothetical protein
MAFLSGRNRGENAKKAAFMGKIARLLVNIPILLINIKYNFLSLRSQIYG